MASSPAFLVALLLQEIAQLAALPTEADKGERGGAALTAVGASSGFALLQCASPESSPKVGAGAPLRDASEGSKLK